MRTHFAPIALAAILGMAAGPSAAQPRIIEEREPNDHLHSPQVLEPAGGPLRVRATMGSVSGPTVDDLDFFQVFLRAGDVVTVAVENGHGGAKDVRLFLAAFKPSGDLPSSRTTGEPTYEVDRVADASPGVDPQIEEYVAPRTGNYVIGVCSWPRYFDGDGNLQRPMFFTNGDYDLVLTHEGPDTLTVPIAIKPGSTDLTPLNPKAKGRLPVAVLSVPGFSPLDVNPESLRFGATGKEESLVSCAGGKGKGGLEGEDLNGDGIPDLVCHFDRPACGFTLESAEGVLTGHTRDGTAFLGRGNLKVVPRGRPADR